MSFVATGRALRRKEPAVGEKRIRVVDEIETFLSDSYKRFRLSLRFQSPFHSPGLVNAMSSAAVSSFVHARANKRIFGGP